MWVVDRTGRGVDDDCSRVLRADRRAGTEDGCFSLEVVCAGPCPRDDEGSTFFVEGGEGVNCRPGIIANNSVGFVGTVLVRSSSSTRINKLYE